MNKMTLKQKKFADEYIISGNMYKSAIAAGYSENYAKGNVSKLFENVRVKNYIDKRLAEIDSKKIADQTEVMQFLTAVMRGEVTEPVAIMAGDGYQEVQDLRPSAQTRRAAAVDIGKRYGMWTDKQEISANVAVQILDDIPDDADD